MYGDDAAENVAYSTVICKPTHSGIHGSARYRWCINGGASLKADSFIEIIEKTK